MVNIFLNGCCGRMGRAIACLCKDSDDYKIVAGCDMMPADDLKFPVYKSGSRYPCLCCCKEEAFDMLHYSFGRRNGCKPA